MEALTRIRTIRVLQNLGLSLDDIFSYYNGSSDMEQFTTPLKSSGMNPIWFLTALLFRHQGEYILHLPEEKALCIFYHGSYETIPSARDKICAYAKESGIALTGTCRHIYLEGPPQHTEPEKFVTQVTLPIAEQIWNTAKTIRVWKNGAVGTPFFPYSYAFISTSWLMLFHLLAHSGQQTIPVCFG